MSYLQGVPSQTAGRRVGVLWVWSLMMDFQTVRWFIGLVALVLLSYFDVFHRTRIPSNLLTALLIIGFFLTAMNALNPTSLASIQNMMVIFGFALVLFYICELLLKYRIVGDAESEAVTALFLIYPIWLNQVPVAVWTLVLGIILGLGYGVLSFAASGRKPTRGAFRRAVVPLFPFLLISYLIILLIYQV